MNSHTVVDHPLAAMHSAGQAGRGRTLNSHVNRLLNDRVPHLKRRRGLGRAHDSHSNNGTGGDAESQLWKHGAFPQYLQESVEASDFCSMIEEARARQDRLNKKSSGKLGQHDLGSQNSSLWRTIRRQAEADAENEPLLSSFLYASILSHGSFERALAFVLANRLSDATLLPTELFEVFYSVLKDHKEVAEAAMADLRAVRERDPACCSYSQALLYFKGFHAIQCHRIAHCLWHAGRRILATALQSRVSEVFAVDIHPAAKLGRGVLLDHGTGVVIGETAEVGNNVSILQNVTLGGTGKEHGDRHPKVSDNVLIGASATILGNIRIGKGAQVAAGSLVLKPVPPRTMVAGSPAKEVGTVSGNPALKMEQWTEKSKEELCEELFTPAGKTSAAVATGIEAAKPGQERRTEDKVASPGEISEKATGKVDSAKAVKTRDGAPPVFEGSVDAVTTDKEAKKKWGSRKPSSDMEYFI